ncbi:hypothetical protein ISN45_At04g033040 [Arabidopsis thaliana x Arabidopsis arenosa]|nr:hypothetical protein ISN45_At04g033040 [Arabidopsis thaliana x Arabidopsis arenosa]
MLQQPTNSSSTMNLEHLNPVATQQFIPNVMPPGAFPGSIPLNASVPPPTQPPAGEKPPPYPLFPPGLIPGIVRKMQIGSRVPYSLVVCLTADPNEPTQYDNVYTSYRKYRSTNYHTSMSARATTR